MAIIGNTIRLSAEFKSFAGVYTDPTLVTLKIYDKNMAQIGETVVLGDAHKNGIGKYYYDYLVPDDKRLGINTLTFYEFCGIIDGEPALNRGQFIREWVRKS